VTNLKYRRGKDWYKSKTLWLNAAAGFFAILQIPAVLFTDLPPYVYPIVLALLGAVNVGLRFITTQPIFVKTILRNDRKYLDDVE